MMLGLGQTGCDGQIIAAGGGASCPPGCDNNIVPTADGGFGLQCAEPQSPQQIAAQQAQCSNAGIFSCFMPSCTASMELGALACIPIWGGIAGVLLLLWLVNR